MKKFVIALLVFITILSVILLLKVNSVISSDNSLQSSQVAIPKYSSYDIEQLILKGKENFEKIDNIYYESHTVATVSRFYFLGNKMKFDYYYKPSSYFKIDSEFNISSQVLDLDEKKLYDYNHEYKTLSISDKTEPYFGFQSILLSILNTNGRFYYYDFTYLKDEEIEGKDCIFIKENIYNIKTGEIIYLDFGIPVYWIEKSTGFMVASGTMQQNEKTTTPESIIKNIRFDVVTDRDFIMPTNYRKIY